GGLVAGPGDLLGLGRRADAGRGQAVGEGRLDPQEVAKVAGLREVGVDLRAQPLARTVVAVVERADRVGPGEGLAQASAAVTASVTTLKSGYCFVSSFDQTFLPSTVTSYAPPVPWTRLTLWIWSGHFMISSVAIQAARGKLLQGAQYWISTEICLVSAIWCSSSSGFYSSATTGLRSTPIPSISTSMTSPALIGP